MAKYLVIVESPAKVKTIKKFLGSNYEVMASNGHVRDLPKSSLGIDVEGDYEPKYITIRGKGDILAALRKAVKKAEKIYLATDPDREGEAISWHLLYALKLIECTDKKIYRITFNEITKQAVKESLKNAREIDMNLVDAQQARRALDRMVGYRISPLLWAKVKRGLSAGRVQSVALRIICDREAEIEAFCPEEYWTLEADFKAEGVVKPLKAKYYGTDKQKAEIHNQEEMNQVLKAVEGADVKISEIKKSERVKKAPLPFTTSTLQQEASKVLNFSTLKTMRLAQQLYEGVEIKGEGTVGLITYLRTDSTRVSEEAEKMAASYIKTKYGEKYAASSSVQKKNDQKIQDAHEAIRPTDINRIPAEVKEQLPRDLFRLYQLIWKRFTASRMEAARYATTTIKMSGNGHVFTVAGSQLIFDGFMSVYIQEIHLSAEGIGKAPGGGVGHGVDGEIPPCQILLDIRYKADPFRVPVVKISAFCPEGGDLHHTGIGDHTHGAMLFPVQDQLVVREDRFRLFRQSIGAEVIVIGCQTQQGIPDTAAYGISGKAGPLQRVYTI